jgi:hypothetical protein
MPTLVSTGQFTIIDVNDSPISNLTPPSELTSVVADSMGGWTRLAGTLSNSSIVNNQVGPNGEYPRILRVVGDGTITGWYTLWRYWFKVDISKAYVSYCWVRKRSATSTNLYLGWTNEANFVDTLAGINETNPYFIPAHNPAIADKWYLCVGVIWPSGYGSGDTGLAGVYDPYTGIRVYDGVEFRHNTAATQQYLRFGFYNNVTAQSSADGYDFLPVGTYCMDGTHPTKEAIMNTVPAAMTAALSKETYVFPANSDGSVPAASYTGSGTQIRVYQGSGELTYDGTGTTKGTWRIASTTVTNITIGSITDSGTFATVADHSGVAAGTDTSTITYNIEGTTLTGASFTLVKTQTFAKAKGGVPGTNGVRTAVLEMYQWASSAPTTFPAGTASTYTWATAAFTAPGTPNGWTITPGASTPGQILYVVTQIYTDTLTTATSSVTWSATTSVATGAAGTNGAAAVTAYATNEAQSLFAYADGNVASFSNANGLLKIYSGSTDVTASADNFTATASGCAGTINTATNTPVNGQPIGYYQVTAMSADTATLTLSARYPATTGTTYTKIYTLSKTKTGYESVATNPSNNLFVGRVVYNTTDKKLYYYNGSAWVAKNGSASTINMVVDTVDAGAITAAQMNVTQLSAITANIGTLRTATTGARTEISDNVIKVYDSTSTSATTGLRVKIGNLA